MSSIEVTVVSNQGKRKSKIQIGFWQDIASKIQIDIWLGKVSKSIFKIIFGIIIYLYIPMVIIQIILLFKLKFEYVPNVTEYPTENLQEEVLNEQDTLLKDNICLYPIHSTINMVEDEKIELLAALIYREARGSDLHEMLCVGNVVINRVNSEFFPNTLEEVVFQPNQYSPANILKRDLTYSSETYIAAFKILVENERVLPDDVVFQSQEPLGEIVYHSKWGHYYCKKRTK